MEEGQTTVKETPSEVLLRVRNLKVCFYNFSKRVKALDGVSFDLHQGEVLGLVGESGSGKSVTALTIAGLLPPNAKVEEGEVFLDGKNILELKDSDLRLIRLRKIAILFQDPTSYLNPIMKIGDQIAEIVESKPEVFMQELLDGVTPTASGVSNAHGFWSKYSKGGSLRRGSKALIKQLVLKYLRLVRIPDPERIYNAYPFELSGGMKQRVMIAMGLIRKPKVIIADEITTALDVTVQAQILKLLNDFKTLFNISVILITHDLGVAAQVCDRVAVMYAGKIVECGRTLDLFRQPLHPYTTGLLNSVPRVGRRLESIRGSIPDMSSPPSGCRFHPRCPHTFERCTVATPEPLEASLGHMVACHLYNRSD